LGAVAVLALGVTGTFSQFVAAINNTNNNASTVGPEAFAFSEALVTGAGVQPVCQQASAGQSLDCTTINKFGSDGTTAPPMAPGSSQSTTVQLKNEATGVTGLSGNLTLEVSPCVPSVPPGDPNSSNGGVAAGDICGALTVAVTCAPPGTASVFSGTLTAFEAGSPYSIATSLAPGGTVDCTFTTTLPSTQTAANLQGLSVNQPLTWTFTQG
jgi:hypothetical protein